MTPTQRIGPYEVVSRIGQGGMGEVWRATDTNLGRDVAIKVLPPEFSNDPERLARFEREARALAALNHTSIASIYGFEQGCLIMEFVAGPGLDEVLKRGPVELDEALRLALQLAEALEAAHGKGIVHRDLKPANLKLTPEGKLKVLDFGLAKAFVGELAASASVTQSPTLTVGTTKAGVLLGTAAYMSPEQARGKTVDKRADIWAFGCIVYEMLTGRQTFAGDSVADILGAVVRAEPDWSLLPASTPASVRRMLRRCLEKDPDKRLRDIGDAALELTEPPEAPVVVTRRKASLWIAGAGIATAAAAVGYFARGFHPEPSERPAAVQRFRVPVSDPVSAGRIRIARSGERFFYRARPRFSERATRPIFVCELDGSAPRLLGESRLSGSFAPSPDGQFVAFGAQNELLKVAIAGGEPQLLIKGEWSPDEWTDQGLILSTAKDTITAIPASGGEARVTARLSGGATYETGVRMLPGGTHLLAVVTRNGESSVVIQDVKGGAPTALAQGASSPLYVPSGHLMYRRRRSWCLAAFDLESRRAVGPDVQLPPGDIRDGVDVDDAGTLVTAAAEIPSEELRVLEPDGKVSEPIALKRRFTHFSASPDGKALLLASGGDGNVWRLDLARGAQTRMTFAERGDETPVWSPDGKLFAWLTTLPNDSSIVSVRAADGSAAERVLYRSKSHDHIESWSPDGRFLLVAAASGPPGISVVSVATGEKRPFFETRFNHRHSVFSPDGRWVAYTSDESGRNEVYVRPFPGPGGKWQISTDGGSRPRWSKDGRITYYLSGAGLMAVGVESKDVFAAGAPRRIFEQSLGEYDVLPGGRFIVFTSNRSDKHEVLVITNFFERARQLAPRSS